MEITIAGLKFKPIVNSTYLHDIAVMNKIREAGLSNGALLPKEGESDNELIERITTLAYESGRTLELLGLLFVPSDYDELEWDEVVAKHVTKIFSRATSAEDKRTLHEQIAGMLLHFFRSALASSQTFPKSSGSQEQSQVGERQETGAA